MPEQRPQARGQRHLLENTLLFSPSPTFPDFQGRKERRGKATRLLLEQALSLAFPASAGRGPSPPQAARSRQAGTALRRRPFLWLR